MTLKVRSCNDSSSNNSRVHPFTVNIVDVNFQAFMHPTTKQTVFSQAGVAKGFNISDTTASNWLKGIRLKRSNGKDVPAPSTLATTINSNPILVVTMADLAGMVKLGAERGNRIAQLIQNAGNAVLIQQSVDEALGIERKRSEYLQAGAQMKQEEKPVISEPTVADLIEHLSPLVELAKEYMATRKAIFIASSWTIRHPRCDESTNLSKSFTKR